MILSVSAMVGRDALIVPDEETDNVQQSRGRSCSWSKSAVATNSLFPVRAGRRILEQSQIGQGHWNDLGNIVTHYFNARKPDEQASIVLQPLSSQQAFKVWMRLQINNTLPL
jgi:hypothetical protein